MPRSRFQQILQFSRFDDKNTRLQRKETDKLAAIIRDIWKIFVENCTKNFQPFDAVTVDE